VNGTDLLTLAPVADAQASNPRNLIRLGADCLPPLLVALAALLLAGLAYCRFVEDPRHLWSSGPHDRNAHYSFALSVALDLRRADVVQLLHDLDGARVWGPLHGVLAGLVLAVGGPDYRLAVLPSLAAWAAAAVLAFLTARRAAGRGGNLAGAAAAVFLLASPAYRAFATDIMLESLGACLTLAVLYCYLVCVQTTSVRAARCLGLALTALFLLKYNYWLLALLPLAAAEAISRGRDAWRRAAAAVRGVHWRAWLLAQVRHPLNYALAAVLALAAYVEFRGQEQMEVLGRNVWVRSPDNLIHLAYVLLFLRVLPWWWRHGRQWAHGLDYPLPQVLAWHGLPVALWFLWPKRPSYFFWYLTRNHGGEVDQHNLAAAASYYWQCLAGDYHPGLASLLLAVGLIGAALLACRRLRPGGAAVVAFVLVAAVLAVRYPSHRSRFLHSWVAAGWVVAGVGLAQVACGRLTAGLAKLRPWLAGAAVGALALVQLPLMLKAGHAPEGGPNPHRPSTLDVTDSYLPDLADARRPIVLSNAPVKQMTHWTYLERYGRRAPIEIDLRRLPPGTSFAEGFSQWLRQTACDTIVFIDAPPGSALFEEPARVGYEQIPALLAGQSDFRLVDRQDLPRHRCTVTVWRRANLSAKAGGF
jgi:hypothetical protein